VAFTITSYSRKTVPAVTVTSVSRMVIPDWRTLVVSSDEELARYDIAAVNLACAEGLPQAEVIDPDYCLATLDAWAEAVRRYTILLTPQFHRKPHEYNHSEAYFRMLCLITVLQRDKGVRYNPAKIPEDAPFDTEDSFIYGIIQGNGGTCASMPVVYAAVGRRLGYPVKLAYTRGKRFTHLFARWDDPKTGERFNVEATNQGLATPDDDHYRTDPYHPSHKLDAEAERQGLCLVSMTPRMEVAGFMGSRAWRWHDMKDWRRCVEAWAWASSLEPKNEFTRNSLLRHMVEWDKEQKRKKPAGFPKIMVRLQERVYPVLPFELEMDIHGLWATQNMLDSPTLEEKYWSKMRRGNFDRIPTEVDAKFYPNGFCATDLKFT
jgi:hypothetical protein